MDKSLENIQKNQMSGGETKINNYKVLEARDNYLKIKDGYDERTFSKDMSSLGISYNINFMDKIIREESYVQNAIMWITEKAWSNGFDLNVRGDNSNIEKIIGVLDEVNNTYIEPLFDFTYLGIGYGGSGGLLVIDSSTDHDEMIKPLRYRDLKQGQKLSIRPLTRLYQIQPDYSREDRYIDEIGEESGIFNDNELGKPKYYRVSISGDMYKKETEKRKASFNNKIDTFLVHRSRLLIYNGNVLSWLQEQLEMFFGQSIVARAINEIKKYKQTLEEIFSLLKRSNLPVINMEGLGDVSRTGDLGLRKIDDLIFSYQYALDTGDILVVGAKDKEELQFLQAEFRELSNILLDRKKELSAALGAPTSATFKVKDDIDENQNFFNVKQIQTRQLIPGLKQIIPIIWKIKYGEDINDFSIFFKSLENKSDKDKLEEIRIASEIVVELFTNNMITSGKAHELLIASSTNPKDMLYQLSTNVNDDNKDKYFKDHQIEIANELNWNKGNNDLNNKENKGYNMVETKIKGRNEGGNNKTTKKIGLDIK